MKTMNMVRYLVIAAALLASTDAGAWFDRTNSGMAHNNGNNQQNAQLRSAGCAPATALTNLELNNVRALIETGGSMWQDRSTGFAAYEVPKGSGTTVIYAGALWMGGVDVNNQLKLAALTFRQGNDFWPGPLTTDGTADVDPATCLEYDKFHKITRAEVIEFNAWYQAGQVDPQTQLELFPNYQIPNSILDYPAHGNVALNYDYNLAPYYDNPAGPNPNNGFYDPVNDGDYPWYDIAGDIECNANDRQVLLFGDETYWWVFNDRGNVHTETGGDPIGMEIRAQAFAFATNDEVNSMTFYNYELINRSTQTLTGTYFGVWVDPDLGCSEDDYVGCDVRRGLGYCYNGDGVDEGCQGTVPYGSNPPAIGVDFFEGPFKDDDGIDNPGPTETNGNFITYNQAVAGDGIVYKGMGIGYGDGVIDNERFGMRRFVYHNRAGVGNPPQATTDPSNAVDYYNYLRGIWKDGTPMQYGGTGYNTGGAETEYMLPGSSDPQGWGTDGVPQNAWSEVTENNAVGDRRFVQSAGPFTLQPGARNNITVGVVYARAAGGGLEAPVDAVRLADDKAQALFDNCFEILEGPDAPDLTIQELDKELIIYIANNSGNNVGEDYEKEDPFIITPDSLLQIGQPYDNTYNFQGYQVFQVADAQVGPQDVYDVDKARLIFQCDLEDSVSQMINWELDESIGVPVPQEMVNGANEGVTHSFRVTEDQFAEGNTRLINHKKYYFLAIAYAHNEFKPFDVSDPLLLDGQKIPYLSSRKSGNGTAITAYTGIPHIPTPEAGGTQINSEFGDGPRITRIEGTGNGGHRLEITAATEASILSNYIAPYPEYENGEGPIDVKVVDPLNVASGDFELRFVRGSSDLLAGNNLTGMDNLDVATWYVVNLGTNDTITSDETIRVGNEQIIPEWGISITIEQVQYDLVGQVFQTDLIETSVEYADSSLRWLDGVEDAEGNQVQNWIRSGTQNEDSDNTQCPDPASFNDYGTDEFEIWENMLSGTIAPYNLCGVQDDCVPHQPIASAYSNTRDFYDFADLQSIDLVFTSDQSKWTRCVVVETQDDDALSADGVSLQEIRTAPSVGKDGQPDGSGTTGMSWFPGYAIDVETGERLNIAFGEDTWLGVDNGNDMIFNPTSRLYTNLGDALFGGKHYVYIFKNQERTLGTNRMPYYDEAAWMHSKLTNPSIAEQARVWRSCMYVMMPMVDEDFELLQTEARVRIRIKKAYERYATNNTSLLNPGQDTSISINSWFPLYRFTTGDLATNTMVQDTAESALDLINVVPNPYYAFSSYEENRLDNRIKIVNLPEQCEIKIYTINGTLVRTLSKDGPLTSIDWDLKNFQGIPIAGGVYIIHVDVPGVGERILKWFGVVRPPDLENF